MPAKVLTSDIQLVNRSAGDPVLFINPPGRNDAFLFDAGTLGGLSMKQLADVQAVFLTHFHLDHFCDFDRVVRANLDFDKTVHVFGPAGAIRRIHRRITSYDLQYFPSMRVAFEVHELHQGRIDTARLECVARFPDPAIVSKPWKGMTIFENDTLVFEATFVDHTAPCVAYALVEKPSTRLAFVTDTRWSDAARPGLLKLAAKASRLYCDSFYGHAQLKKAEEFRHMTARHAAEFAAAAKVDQLILMHFASRYAGRYQILVDEAREIFPKTSAEVPEETPKGGTI